MKNFKKYFTITALEERWGLYLTTAGYNRIEPAAARTYPPNREHPSTHAFTWKNGRVLGEYQLVYITSGTGLFESAHIPLRSIHGGTCFLIYPGTWHRYKPDPNSGWTEYWIGFKGFFPDHFMKQGLFREDRALVEIGIDEEILILFQKLAATVQASEMGYLQVLSAILLEIMARIHSIAYYEGKHKSADESMVVKAKFLMREAMEESTNIEEIVKELPVSYSKFRKVFKQVTGESPNQYYLNLRLKKATSLLDSSNLPINEIAYQTGFESVFYFSRLFKKKYALSPKAYREIKRGGIVTEPV